MIEHHNVNDSLLCIKQIKPLVTIRMKIWHVCCKISDPMLLVVVSLFHYFPFLSPVMFLSCRLLQLYRRGRIVLFVVWSPDEELVVETCWHLS